MDRVFHIVKSYLKRISLSGDDLESILRQQMDPKTKGLHQRMKDHKEEFGTAVAEGDEDPKERLRELILKIRKDVKYYNGQPAINIKVYSNLIEDSEEDLTEEESEDAHSMWLSKAQEAAVDIFGSGMGAELRTEGRSGGWLLLDFRSFDESDISFLESLSRKPDLTHEKVSEAEEEYEEFIKQWNTFKIHITNMLSRDFLRKLIEEVRS